MEADALQGMDGAGASADLSLELCFCRLLAFKEGSFENKGNACGAALRVVGAR